MIKRTLQVSSSKHSIKKDMLFSLGQIEIVLVGQGGVLQPPLPPLGYAPAKDPRIHSLDVYALVMLVMLVILPLKVPFNYINYKESRTGDYTTQVKISTS